MAVKIEYTTQHTESSQDLIKLKFQSLPPVLKPLDARLKTSLSIGEPEPIYNIVSPETPSSTYNDPYGGFQDPRVSTYSGKVPTSTPGKWSDEEFDSDEEHK